MNHVSTLENALQRLTQHLEVDPRNANIYVQRGMVRFKLGDIAAAIGDFDRAEHLNPALTPYLWQRGLAYYYAGRFVDGARQFEVDLTVNRHDVEETVWRYLCQAQVQGAPAARADLLPVRHDTRPVMAWVYKLFAGACDAETVLAQHRHAGRGERFYSALYVGLYGEAKRDAACARQHITQAVDRSWKIIWAGSPSCISACEAGTNPKAAANPDAGRYERQYGASTTAQTPRLGCGAGSSASLLAVASGWPQSP